MLNSWTAWIGWGVAVVALEVIRRRVFNKTTSKVKEEDPPKLNLVVPKLDERPLLTDVIKYWSKSVEDIPIFADLPRFATKITIYSIDRTMHPPPLIVKSALKSLFELTAQCLQESEERRARVINGFAQEFSTVDVETVDMSLVLRDYIEKYVDVNSRMVRLLRTCGQHIIAPAVQRLKPDFMNAGIPYKDVRGGWTIDIKYEADRISVIHNKKEQTQSYDEEDHFEFQWHLRIDLDLNIDYVMDSQLWISNYSLSPDMEPKLRDNVLATIKPFYRT